MMAAWSVWVVHYGGFPLFPSVFLVPALNSAVVEKILIKMIKYKGVSLVSKMERWCNEVQEMGKLHTPLSFSGQSNMNPNRWGIPIIKCFQC